MLDGPTMKEKLVAPPMWEHELQDKEVLQMVRG